MPYVSEIIAVDELSALLNAQWNTQSDNIPEPTFVVLNDPANPQLRFDLQRADHVFIAVDTPGLEEVPIGNWSYGHRTTRILLELATKASRQRLYDIMQEIRRICHSQMHSMTSFQRLQFVSFNELTADRLNQWAGRIIVELKNSAALLEV